MTRRPTHLPNVEASEQHAWREGFWHALPVGLVIGFALAVVFLSR